jgi:hypothetical protein
MTVPKNECFAPFDPHSCRCEGTLASTDMVDIARVSPWSFLEGARWPVACPRLPGWPAPEIVYWGVDGCLRPPHSNPPRRSFIQRSAQGPMAHFQVEDDDVSTGLRPLSPAWIPMAEFPHVLYLSEGPRRCHVSVLRRGDDLSTCVRCLHLIICTWSRAAWKPMAEMPHVSPACPPSAVDVQASRWVNYKWSHATRLSSRLHDDSIEVAAKRSGWWDDDWVTLVTVTRARMLLRGIAITWTRDYADSVWL